MMFLMWYFRS